MIRALEDDFKVVVGIRQVAYIVLIQAKKWDFWIVF